MSDTCISISSQTARYVRRICDQVVHKATFNMKVPLHTILAGLCSRNPNNQSGTILQSIALDLILIWYSVIRFTVGAKIGLDHNLWTADCCSIRT